ncbi:MAG: hypothetical protein AAGC45_01955 [Bacteroidota bacterium]
MVKNLLIALVCLLSFGIYAQNGTISPYSYFGVGDTRNNGTIDNRQMGGLQMYGDSIHINLRNPAAFSKLRLTTYTAGITHRELQLRDNFTTQRTSVTNLDYLAIGFPIAKNAGIGLGIQPFTSVGYDLVTESINAEQDTVRNVFVGEGGLNRVFVSFGFEPIKNVSLGVTGNFNFGTLQYNRSETTEGVQLGTLDSRESRISGFDLNIGGTYTPRIGKYTLFTHVGVDTQINLVSENSRTIGSFSETQGEIEVFDVDLEAQNLKNTELKIPTRSTIGLGFGEDRRWFIGGEYSFQELSTFQNTFLGQDNVSYADASTMALGGYFVPNYAALSGILNRITYRAGLRYDETGLVVNEKEINNFGITFGFGIPIVGTGTDRFSNLNIGFELGRRGTRAAGLLEENYFNVSIGISLNALWFQKRKIN